MSKFPYLSFLAVVFCALLPGCSQPSQTERLAQYNSRLGEEAIFDGLALSVKWPSALLKDHTVVEALSLRIPKKYLSNASPIRKTDSRVTEIYFHLPPVLPYSKRTSLDDSAFKWNPTTLYRDQRFTPNSVAFYKALALAGRKILDGEVAGLQRYSLQSCYSDAEIKSGAATYLAQKETSDRSPSNCRLDRSEATYLSPDESAPVMVECHWGGRECNVSFAAYRRLVEFRLPIEELGNWQLARDAVELALNQFKPSNATNNGELK